MTRRRRDENVQVEIESLFVSEEPIESDKSEEERLQKIEQERETLLARLSRGDDTHLITRVAHIINRFPSTRNSDITLQLRYWEEYSEGYDPNSLDPHNLYEYERLTSIARARAKIQNECGPFLATEDCRRHRRNREAIERERQLATAPETGSVFVYCDESGYDGTSVYMQVGGVWVVESDLQRAFYFWKKDNDIQYEFHFTKMDRRKKPMYQAFFDYALENNLWEGSR